MEKNINHPKHPDELNEMLLVLEKKQNKTKAVTQLTKKGQVKAAAPTTKNQPDFLRIERNGGFFTNFFGNFLRQLKELTHLIFFACHFLMG